MINKQDSLTGREIAVIGMSGRFPGARNLKEFWSNLRNGVEAVRLLGDEELVAAGEDPRHLSDPHYVKAASMLDDVDLFDASFFGYNAREAEIMDPQQRLFLEHAFEALEDAGYSPTQFDGLIGVYAGVAWNTYLLSNLSTHLDLFQGGGAFQVFITNDKDFMPTRLSYKLNLKGPSLIIQTSCSTSLVAIHLACLSLLNYECDIALAGGVTVKVPQASGYFHQDGGLASPDGHCRAFDAKAAGTIFGSGIGVVTLKRLSEALKAGDPIRAVIRGTAINNDGSSKVSYTAPSVEGQAEVIAAAQAMAGVPAESIQYIETHGTGTSLGDPVEVTALTKAFSESTQKRAFCAIGSVKTNFGHLDAAAGVAGFIKTVLSLENRELPPSLNYEQPNPAIEFGKTPFYVNSGLKTWERNGSPRRAGVSSFGVGGTNAHVILEEAPPAEQSGASRPYQLLLLSARTAPALQKTRENLLNYLQEHEHAPLADVAYTLQSGRTVFRQRLALVCKDRADAIQALQADSRRSLTAVDKEEPRDRPVVFMFSGQGSQYVNMTRGLYEHEKTFHEQFDICAKTLKSHIGCDLAKFVFPAGGDEQQAATQLEQTAFAQPALFAIEFSLAALWMKWGIMPRAMMGHSIGEYVAATLAGVMSLEDALALVAVRGRLMQQQPAGKMLAVLMPEAELLALLPQGIDLAAVNGPSSCVVSGPIESIDALQSELAARAVDVRSLHTSHAFHSSMMDALLSPFLQEVKRISLHPPRIPYISNLTGTWIKAEQATDPDYWVQHLRQTVRFSQGLSELLQDRERIFLEVGPGRTLATLAARHPGRQEQLVLSSQRHPTEEIPDPAKVLETLGRLWMAGVTFDWQKFYEDENRRRLSLPSYPFERQRFWIDSIARSPIPRAAHSNSVRKNDIGGWFYLPSWRASLPPAITAEPQQTWMVLADSFGLGETMADHLGQQGRTTILVKIGGEFVRCNDHAYEIQAGNKTHFIQLFEELRDRKSLPTAIVHAWSLTHGGPHASEIPEFEDSQEAGFYSLLFLLQTLSQYSDSGFDLTVLSNHALSVGGECPSPEKALLLGLCSVAPQEFSHINCRFMDVDLQAHSVILSGSIYAPLAEQLVAEIDGRAPESVIALRGSQRWVRSFDPVSVEQASASPLRQGGTYLLSGGLTGNGYSIARYLAGRWKANLIFLEAGASALQPAVVSPELITSKLRLQKLESLGARVLLLNADITNKHQLLNAWDEAESRLGEIHGVIHADEPVGENTFRAISEAQRQDFTVLFRPKVHALFALESVLQTKKVDFCVLLSSLASVLGGIGYGGYTAANLFMDTFAHDRNRSGNVRWLSLNCDLWLGEDRRDEITKVRGDLVDLAMTEAEGEEAFSRALRPGAADQILVSTADLNSRIADSKQRIENLRKRERESEHTNAPAVLHARPSLPTAYVSPETEMEKRIAAVWQRVLGFENVGLDDNFFDLGGDSLVAIQMAKQLKQELELDFPVAKLYQGVTIRALAQLLAQDEGQTRKQMAVELGELKQTAVERKEFQKRARARKQEARA